MSWWQYLVLVNIYLCLFYAFYRMLLQRETFFQLNRLYLVGTAILSFFIPLMQSEWIKELFITRQVQHTIYGSSALTIVNIAPINNNPVTFGQVLSIIYVAGVIILFAKLCLQLIMLKKIIKDPSPEVAYSFFNKIKVDKGIDGEDVIQHHEQVHARQFHTADILIIEAVMIINWFNPVVYLYRYAIKHVHEFIADKHTLEAGTNKADYAMLLLNQTFNAPAHRLVNPFFNHSLLKQRIMMLQKNKSQRIKLIKYGLSAPLFVLMLVLSSATISNSNTVKNINRKAGDVLASPAKEVISGQYQSSKNENTEGNAQMVIDTVPKKQKFTVTVAPSFPGGEAAFARFLASNIKYPVAAKNNKVQGRSLIAFTIGTDGSLSNFKVAKGIGGGADEEAIRVIKMSPKWAPATVNGQPVKTSYVVPVNFSLDGSVTSVTNKPDGADLKEGEELFTEVEQSPSFPGGVEAFGSFLAKNIRYPKEAKENNIQGRVIATFIVEQDGSLSNIRIVRGIGAGADEEAVRVLAISPKWIAGVQNGHKVRVQYTVPINFALADEDNGKEKKIGLRKYPSQSSSVLYKDTIANGAPLKLRGFNNPPLYLVDGKVVKDIQHVDPNTIQSMTVSKDRSAILKYGSDGVNGVVEITTKAKAKAVK
ncbi:hypothetical protein CKK33_01580 [Mucilaginibacter sp. MD40]|uniref:M56 family metallopeptidase n=1 Tax=Mucilaginibacter sp. MD40 TaxID=2029590 RepID=UPI000BAC4FE5|nr:M56 family metallopeptidase [Mucilaginibacter sp. MD40]PAW92253.1 hypothetical protein CKK33_01580 [Mucilaginibacter sp. MD40]